ncbi:hypothetical protein [Polaribacter sargassicola]|uniref:hypothetical protein n=1 Tax=Polaribacter sargassicola TaxID=2836891 RepID=UPI001F270166|nr:hypothetical protein [Polaribacter sp. DS7-9]MCG1035403.1 hypothetical protein [Polaribacter sp. DS7-9]
MKQIIYLVLFVSVFSCTSKNKSDEDTSKEKPKLSIAKQHKSLVKVKPVFEKEIGDWKDFRPALEFIEKFEYVSPNEALSNALELKGLVLNLRDSIKPPIFNTPSFDARVNVLYNETLRLADLTLIPAITAKDVNLQVDKTIDAFSSVNSKINTVLSKKEFEEAIDIDVVFIGLDSTKIDSVSKKTIDLRKKKELLQIDKKNK